MEGTAAAVVHAHIDAHPCTRRLLCTLHLSGAHKLAHLYMEPPRHARHNHWKALVLTAGSVTEFQPMAALCALRRVKLDGVVTVVDAKHVELRLNEDKGEGVPNEAVEQIAYADRILLNKTDLVRVQIHAF